MYHQLNSASMKTLDTLCSMTLQVAAAFDLREQTFGVYWGRNPCWSADTPDMSSALIPHVCACSRQDDSCDVQSSILWRCGVSW